MVKRSLLLSFLLSSALLAACSGSAAPSATPLSVQEMHGQQLFTQYCSPCHSTFGDAVIVGPSLAGLATRAESRVAGLDARSYIEQSILDPSLYVNQGFADLMPKNWGQVLTGEELDALVAYLLTLR